jgi:hypothetical protein
MSFETRLETVPALLPADQDRAREAVEQSEQQAAAAQRSPRLAIAFFETSWIWALVLYVVALVNPVGLAGFLMGPLALLMIPDLLTRRAYEALLVAIAWVANPFLIMGIRELARHDWAQAARRGSVAIVFALFGLVPLSTAIISNEHYVFVVLAYVAWLSSMSVLIVPWASGVRRTVDAPTR